MKFTFTIDIDVDVDWDEPAKCHICNKRINKRDNETLYIDESGYYQWRHVTCAPDSYFRVPGVGLSDLWADMADWLTMTFPEVVPVREDG